MKGNNLITEERLKQTLGDKSGCSQLFLRVLKSDLYGLLSQYMSLEALEFSISKDERGVNLTIEATATKFLEIGKSDN